MNLIISSESSYLKNEKEVIRAYIHIKRLVVVGTALISVVEEPDVSDIGDFVIWASKEGLEVLGGFNELRQPNHSWQVSLSSRDVGT